MNIVQLDIRGTDNTAPALSSAQRNFQGLQSSVESIQGGISSLVTMGKTFIATWVFDKVWDGFKAGIEAVDSFSQSVIKMAAVITSLQGGSDIAGNYARAKQYAEGLNQTLQEVDARTVLNLSNLQTITEEMVKQGVVMDNTSKAQVSAFTNIANAVAVYSNNGRNEVQVRQEIAALLRGEVDQNSQLASMLQKTVDGPLKKHVEQWKASGTFIEEIGKRLAGFGPAADDLAGSWSAVTSSLQTSANVLLRAGFGDIVKDLVSGLGKANEYLKEHAGEIGNRIKQGWMAVKGFVEGVYNGFIKHNEILKIVLGVVGQIFKGWGLLLTAVFPPLMERIGAFGRALWENVKMMGNLIAMALEAGRGNFSGAKAYWDAATRNFQEGGRYTAKAFASGFGDEIARRSSEFLALDNVAAASKSSAAVPKITPAITEEQKKEALKHFREQAKEIIDIEQDRIKRLLEIEKEYGKKLQEQYKERVDALDVFRKAYDAILQSKEERDKRRADEQAAALRGPEDAYQRYYRIQAELTQKQNELDNEGTWSPASIAKRLKGYDDLIKKSEEQLKAVKAGSVENISLEQAEYNDRLLRESLEQRIIELGGRQLKQMEDSAVQAAEESDAWQRRIKATEDKIRVLAQMLDNLPKVKEIDINLRVNGLAGLQNIAGVMAGTAATGGAVHYGDYYTLGGQTFWNDGTLADSGTSFAQPRANGGPVSPFATYRINEDGTEYLTMGSKGGYITPAGQGPAAAGVTIEGGVQFVLPNVTNHTTARELARMVLPELQQLQQRYRTA